MLDKNDGAEYELESLTRLPEYLDVPAGTLNFSTELAGNIRYGTPMQVKTIIYVNNFRQMTIVTSWRLKKYADVVVAIRDIPVQTVLSYDDVTLERREVTRVEQIFYKLDDVVGMQMRRTVFSGTLLNRFMISRPVIIKQGSNVTIISISGVVSVQTQGQALQSGGVGDVIRVRNLLSGKSMLARIENETTVVIDNTVR